jgi:type IV pilus assembly protein PilE
VIQCANREAAHQRGFTLVELLIVVAIIGILAAFVFPAYQTYVANTQRTTAKGQMVDLAQALERYKAQNFSYKDATVSALAPELNSNRFYTASLTVSTTDSQSYTITATPKSSMAGDGVLKLDSDGNSCYTKGGNCTLSGGSSW